MSVLSRSCLALVAIAGGAWVALPAARAAAPRPALRPPTGWVAARPDGFTVEDVKSAPFPNQLTAAARGGRIAWALDEQGQRNVWVAEGPQFAPRRLTPYTTDDGQEITSLSLSADGKYAVYVRGGDHSGSWDDSVLVNPAASPTPAKVQVWSVPFDGGEPKALGDGDLPAVSPRSDVVAFEKDHQIWVAPLDGSIPAKALVALRGENGAAEWSPDGARLAFVSNRGDHSFIGVFAGASEPVVWIAPSTSRDVSPRWSPDGRRLAFVRRPGTGGAPTPVLVARPVPWAIWTADAQTGEARALWTSPETLRGSYPTTHGETNLHWAAGDRIVFLSYMDGWPHLYSIAAAGQDKEPLLLTPGSYMAEYIKLSPDRRLLVFAANSGPDPDDVDRRHVVKAPVDRAAAEVLTPGTGLEWTPVVTGDGADVVFLGATAARPPIPMALSLGGSKAAMPRALAADLVPSRYPEAQLVVPRKVVYKAPDGLDVHAQIFERAGGDARPGTKKPAVIFVHGGPPRQMLLGWHYSDYYANAYALNQYLASRGFVVLAVNYRLGIGYGYEFHRPPQAGAQGASEYQDVKAAGEYLRTLPQVDPRRIGIYGGSYGGFLTALALARDSALFAAGVDIHGVHDWAGERARPLLTRDRYETAPDLAEALDAAWRSSPISQVSTWKSPVLLIHGDDDRNVRFAQTVDLVQRLAAAHVPYEEIVIPDDTHHFMRHSNWVKVDAATAEFLERKLGAR
ncbi:MAG TPA: prolyl oligopeptidase family serine peptidase [Vicinamibacteria bacterium]|nr:prolyl oligopeptidase family serine peptidase [Vicinamibacteria bacterium]